MRQRARRHAFRPALLSLAAAGTLATAFAAQSPSPALSTTDTADAPRVPVRPAALPAVSDEDVLWLARCAYSETKRPHEQRLVAWVVRNRVETRYRGARTVRDAVLAPYQFSAFNPASPKRAHYLGLQPLDEAPGWQRAQIIAREVLASPSEARPFPLATRHFYSEQSMVGRRSPAWSHGRRAVQPEGAPVEPRRFRFFSGVAVVLAV
jgi:hypothetical protein